jgi:hypothetical protein
MNLSLAEIETKLQQSLIDGMYFVAEEVNLPELQQYDYNSALDHDWHEFEGVEYCEELGEEITRRDISHLLLSMERMQKSSIG